MSHFIKAFINIVPNAKLNSYNNGMATVGIQNIAFNNQKIINVEFLRGGMPFPLKYQIKDNKDYTLYRGGVGGEGVY